MVKKGLEVFGLVFLFANCNRKILEVFGQSAFHNLYS